ncbi:efflux RND transporter periplasmic adaptor subunit [Enhygromyxa salina]|uniref:efflux RND transporter periplasmic adaptor subunit n=1 Tax=Enhygromyxa salina TaxID=215803 RepID=UPI0015E6F709|nr:efflux RND transporter periplasmic adaptor subunit [Enhygromyxa salina]
MITALALVPVACTDSRAAPSPVAEDEPEATVPSSSLIVVENAEVGQWLVTTGSLLAHDRAEVVPDVSGKVIEVLVERGAHVDEGDPLFRLDVRNAKLNVREAKANLAGLEAAQALAETTCARSASLFSHGAVPSSEVQRDQAACRQAEENVRGAKVRAQAASKSVSDGIVRAPFSGVVAIRSISLGEWASVGASMLTLVEDGPLRAELELSEAASIHVQIGTQVELSALALPDDSVHAVVTRIAPDLDPRSRSRVAEVELPEHPSLVPGMFVRAKVITGTRSMPAVPRAALLARGSTWRAFVAVDGQVEERVVQLGPELDDDRVTIVRGLEAGDSIVGSELAQLHDGQLIH